MATLTPTPNFSPIARLYRWLEYLSFGPLLQRARTTLLPQVTHARNALILGDGDGRFLATLLAASPQLRATAVDASPAMLALLTRRCNTPRLATITADIRTFTPPPLRQYDLIVTHFFLDCLTTEEISSLAARLAPHLAPDTLWLLSDFALPQPRILRPIARAIIASLYFAFGQLTGLRIRHLPDHAHSLTTAGFHRIAARPLAFGLLIAELWKI